MSKSLISVEKSMRRFLGVKTFIYRFLLHEGLSCNKNGLQPKHLGFFASEITAHKSLFKRITVKQKFRMRHFPKDHTLSARIIDYLKPEGKIYTFCLSHDELTVAEAPPAEWSKFNPMKVIKDALSKHVSICRKDICASGELVIKNGVFIFNNASGTYQPSLKNLKILKKALPWLKIKLTSI